MSITIRCTLERRRSVLDSDREWTEVHFSTGLQAQQMFASAQTGEVGFTSALHP